MDSLIRPPSNLFSRSTQRREVYVFISIYIRESHSPPTVRGCSWREGRNTCKRTRRVTLPSHTHLLLAPASLVDRLASDAADATPAAATDIADAAAPGRQAVFGRRIVRQLLARAAAVARPRPEIRTKTLTEQQTRLQHFHDSTAFDVILHHRSW